MAITTYSLTGSLLDIVGVNLNTVARKPIVVLESSQPLVSDIATGAVRVGGRYAVVVATDGTVNVTGIPATVGGTPLYRLIITTRQADTREKPLTLATGWFSLTASRTIAWVVDNAVQPEYLSPAVVARIQAAAAIGSNNDTLTEALVKNTAGVGPLTSAALTAAYVRRGETVLKAAAYGLAVGNTAAQNKTAIDAATVDALSLLNAGSIRSVIVEVGRGKFSTNKLTVPGGVSLVGEGRDSSVLVNGATDGGVFVNFAGSRSRIAGLTVDGQRAIQVTAGSGLAAVQFSRPNNLLRAGGVTLGANIAAGATSLTVDTASPGGEIIRPGEVITLTEGGDVEQVRVARTYTSGTTIALESPTLNAFTTACKASVAVSDVGAHDCLVYSNGRDGIAFWHTQGGYADRNLVRDFEDTALDIPSAGSRFVKLRDNHIEGKGRWGVAMDTAEPALDFGIVSDCESRGNVIRFLAGGSGFVSGGATDGIYLGVNKRCMSINDTIDLTHAGISGMRYAGSGSLFADEARIVNPTVIGPTTVRTGTFGIRNTGGALNMLIHVTGGSLSGVAKCIEVDQARTAAISNVRMRGFTDYGVNFLADPTNVMLAQVSGCIIDGGVGGVRFGGTGSNASNAVRTSFNILRAQSFAPVIADAGWNHAATGNI